MELPAAEPLLTRCGSGRWLGHGGERSDVARLGLLAFEDHAAEKTPAVAVLEHGGEHVVAMKADAREGELEAVGPAGAIPMLALLLEGEERADPGIDDAVAARIGVATAKAEELEHDFPGGLGGIAELVLKLELGFDAVGAGAVGPVLHLREDRVDAHARGAEHDHFGVVAFDGFGS